MAGNPFADGCACIDGKYFSIAEACILITDADFRNRGTSYISVFTSKMEI